MDPFKKFLIFCVFCIIFERSYGRKSHNYIPYYGSSKSFDVPKFVEKKSFNMYPESSLSDGRPETAQMFEISADVSKFQQSLPQSENKNNPSKLDSTDKTIEMQVGEHLVKVQSKKEPLSPASKDGGHDSFINPKYSHVIEIIHRGDNLGKPRDKLAQIYDVTEEKQAVEVTETANSEEVTDESEYEEFENEDFSETDEGIPEESDETEEEFSESDEGIPEESDEIEEEFSESDEGIPEESDEIEEEFSESDEGIPEESDEIEEEFSESDEGIPEESDEIEEEFSESDEGIPEESDEIEEEFSESDEGIPEESDEIEEEFSESDEGIPEESDEIEEEFSESDEGIPEESDEIEEEFSESDEGIPEELDETEEEFSEANEEIREESEETELEFSEADEGMPEEFDENDAELSEADEGMSDETDEEFSKEDVEMPEESDDTNEEKFSEDNLEIAEEYDKTNEEFSEDVEIPEESEETNGGEFSEVDEEIPGESDETDEKDGETEEGEFEADEGTHVQFGEANEKNPDVTENTVGNNNAKENGTSNEQITRNEESDFKEVFEGSGEEFADINDRSTTKTGRVLGMFSRQNETFPNCTTPKGEAGHCRRLGTCLLSEALNNFNGFLQQLCLIRGVLVGICCPDNPVIETLNPDENETSELKPEDIKQPTEGCGLNTKTRIVGGSISVPHEWTWMVALMRRNRFYCGGVIINNWYILTAAHCVMGMNVKDLTVRLGEYDFNEESKHIEDLSVAEIKRHAQFVTLTFQHDIALLKLKRSIKYSKFVGSICLPEQKARDYSNVKGTVVGWGTVSFGGAASPVLRQVTVPVWKNQDCDRTYLLESIGDSFMCAGAPEKGEDACQGDSGGPLMTVNENGRWEVIGLVSWGRRCGDPTYPGVYTRVTTYLDWIKQNAV